jgi:MFS family permease
VSSPTDSGAGPGTADAAPPDLDRPVGASLVWATWALFVGLGLLLVGVGLFATALGVRAEVSGANDLALGLIGASYYGGFLAGATLTTSALHRVGHVRVYTALASLLAAVMITTGLTDSPAGWIPLRFVSGACIAGLYVVAESWLNQLAANEHRGRLLAVYMVVTSGAYGIGQILVGSVESTTVAAFAVAALLTSIAVAPVALSEDAKPPEIERSVHLELRKLAKVVPTGVGTCLLVGLTHGAFIAMGAIYATRAGLSSAEAGRFVAVTAVGGVLTQWPISTASDEIDRRFVGFVIALGSVAASVWLLAAGPEGWAGLGAMTVLGGLSLPLYSIAAAYTNDWVEPEHVTGAASQLIVLYGIGAFVGPMVTAGLMRVLGVDGYPWALIAMHVAIVAFLVYRMFAWRAPIARRAWSDTSYSTRVFFLPATVVSAGLRLGRRARR